MTSLLQELGIATCDVTYGKEASFAGVTASLSISVVARTVDGDDLRLVWEATGDVLTSFEDSSSSAADSHGSIELAQTGQDGFVQYTADGPVAVKDWYYTAKVSSRIGSGKPKSRTYRFQIPAGVTSLDLERIPEDGVVVAGPSSAPLPSVTSVNGSTGVVTGLLEAGNNLSDVTDPAAARSALDVLSAGEVSATYLGVNPDDRLTVTFSPTQPIVNGVETALTSRTSMVDYLWAAPGSDYAGTVTSSLRGASIGVRVRFFGTSACIKVTPRSTSPMVKVWAGDTLVTPRAGTALPSAMVNTPQYVKLTFSTPGPHVIRLRTKDCDIAAVVTEQTGAFGPSPSPETLQMVVLGDSWTGGAGATNNYNTFAGQLAGLLGLRESIPAGLGGTGYVNAGSTYAFGDVTNRLAPIVAAAPSDILIVGSVNDGGTTFATLKSAAAAVYSYFATNLPSARLHVCLPQPGAVATQTSINQVLNREAILEAASAATNVYTIIDPVGDAIFTGTGNAGAPANNGNRDRFLSSDGVHPTQDGHDYFAAYIASKLAPLFRNVRLGKSVSALPTITTYVFDSFTRANGALGSADTGQAWVTAKGTWSIASNVAVCSVTDTTLGAIASIDASAADVHLKVTIGGGVWGQGLLLRADSTGAGYMIVANTSQWQISKRPASGTPTLIQGWSRSVVSGDVLEVIASGSSITVIVNGVTLGTITDSTYTGTFHGLLMQSSARTLSYFSARSK